MYKKRKILGLILARGGSKSIPKKNIKKLGGKPLISYTIEKAKKSKYIDRLILSTDNLEIARIANKNGCEVPFMRPTRLALDDTKDFPVFAHALNWLNDNEAWVPDIIVHLRPTHPFRKTSDIDKGIKMLISDERADAVWSVGVPPVTPYKMFRTTKEGYLKPILKLGKKGDSYTWPRQKLPKAYNHYGQVDVVRYGTVMNKKSMSGKNILPLFLDDRQLVDIDSLLDWDFAEYLLRKGCITDEY